MSTENVDDQNKSIFFNGNTMIANPKITLGGV